MHAGLTYWTMSLGHHDTANRRVLQRTIEGSLVPDDSLATSVANRHEGDLCARHLFSLA